MWRLNPFKAVWRRWFAIEEIENSSLLQALYWLLLFGFFLSFSEWISVSNMTIEAASRAHHVCPPYFLNCGDYYFFNGWPDSYGQSLFYAGLTAILALSALAAYYKDWCLAHALMVPAFLWKVLLIGVLTYQTHMDFEYFHLPEVFVFLFLARKEYFLRLTFVAIYFIAATMKFTESWIVGSYFTSLKDGLPLFPDSAVPWITNAVALFEILTPPLLLSRNRKIRLPVVAAWTVFHLYSIVLVQFRYPAHCLPLLWLLFLPDPGPNPAPAKALRGGWIFLALIFFATGFPRLQSQDWLYTLQSKKLSVGMFAANYQCQSNQTFYYKDGHQSEGHNSSRAAMHRCEPYREWFRLHELCRVSSSDLQKISWQYDSSINGGPFYRLVDVEDACVLSFNSVGLNTWLKTPSTGAEVIGYPAKNSISKKSPRPGHSLVHVKPQIELSPLQEWLFRHVPTFTSLYWALWLVTLSAMGRSLIYRSSRK